MAFWRKWTQEIWIGAREDEEENPVQQQPVQQRQEKPAKPAKPPKRKKTDRQQDTFPSDDESMAHPIQ